MTDTAFGLILYSSTKAVSPSPTPLKETKKAIGEMAFIKTNR